MRYLDVCTGLSAATVAWRPLGWRPAAFAEIEPFPSAVLAHHYPHVPNAGDFTKIRGDEYGAIDLLVAGTPCQSFSIAGLRRGLDDSRGNMALEFLRLVDRTRARWLLWENVPGVLSSNGGRDFGAILGGMVELGYGFAYRVLDAQFVRTHGFLRAVPQRRRRVFVVGHLGDWRRAAAVLFERESLRGDSAPRREAGKGPAPTIAARTRGGGGLGTDFDCDGGLIASLPIPLKEPMSKGDAGALRNSVCGNHGDPMFTLGSSSQHGIAIPSTGDECQNLIAFDTTQITHPENRCNPQAGDPCHPLAAAGHAPAIAFQDVADPITAVFHKHHGASAGKDSMPRNHILANWAVRRLLPIECERLQGFREDYTLVPYRGKPAADGPRYKALGNSMAVNCMAWIGTRIDAVEALDERIAA